MSMLGMPKCFNHLFLTETCECSIQEIIKFLLLSFSWSTAFNISSALTPVSLSCASISKLSMEFTQAVNEYPQKQKKGARRGQIKVKISPVFYTVVASATAKAGLAMAWKRD